MQQLIVQGRVTANRFAWLRQEIGRLRKIRNAFSVDAPVT
jgi:hypothetical protein